MTKKELEEVKKHLIKSKSLNYDFGSYSKIYNMTTENIFGFLNHYDLKGKRILTVAGSGDQRLNAYSMGADDVLAFDINLFCELHMNLKDTAIKVLSYEDFVKFFGLFDLRTFFDKDIFNKLESYLNYDAYMFYDFIVNNSYNIKTDSIYYDFNNKLSLMEKMNSYINTKRYNKLSSILREKQIEFFNIDIDNLPELLKGEKFDLILLSNISDYIHLIYKENDLERYRDLIDRLEDLLNLYGIIQVGYIYSIYSRLSDVSKFHINLYRHKYFPTDKFHTMFVDSYYNDGTYDKVITYQKFK